jgi:hypothetical protein
MRKSDPLSMENIGVQRERKLVIKAGGSILSHGASFESTANSIMSHLDTYDRIFVVVSAPNGITDMITRLLDSPDESESVMILNRIRENLLLTEMFHETRQIQRLKILLPIPPCSVELVNLLIGILHLYRANCSVQ